VIDQITTDAKKAETGPPTLTRMCDLLEVSRSDYYAWQACQVAAPGPRAVRRVPGPVRGGGARTAGSRHREACRCGVAEPIDPPVQLQPFLLQIVNAVTSVREGRRKLHYLNAVPIHDIQRRWIWKFEEPRLAAIDAIKQRAEEYAMHDANPQPIPEFVYTTYIRATPEQVWESAHQPGPDRPFLGPFAGLGLARRKQG